MDAIIGEISNLAKLVVCGIGVFTAIIGLMNLAEGASNTDPAANEVAAAQKEERRKKRSSRKSSGRKINLIVDISKNLKAQQSKG